MLRNRAFCLARSLILLGLLILGTSPVRAQETEPLPWYERTSISLLAFGDYYAVLEHHDESIEGNHGFWLRRINLTFDQKISDRLSARLRFEAANPGDFASGSNLEPFVKDAWVRWRRSEQVDLTVGIAPTPSYDSVEAYWGYRSVEKTPLDLHRWLATRDFGVLLAGRMAADSRIRYKAMVGNGSGTGTETNSGKHGALLVGFAPSDSSVIELFGDFEDRPAESDRTTFQAFFGLRRPGYRLGAQLGRQNRETAAGDDSFSLASAFAIWEAREKLNAILRVDRLFDPSPEGDRIPYLPFDPAASESTLLIAGLDFALHKNLGIIPNVEWVMYDGNAGDDVIPRITFYYSF